MDRYKAAIPRLLSQHWRLLLVLGAYAAVTLPHIGFIPFWDGGAYLKCATEAIEKSFDIANFRCAAHGAPAYLLLVGALQALDYGNVALVYLFNIALGCAAGISFARLVRRLLRTDDPWMPPLAAAMLILTPVAVAHIFHINLDTPMVFFWVIGLDLLFAKRFGAAALPFAAMVLSKETGIGVLVLTAVLYAAFEVWEPRKSVRRNAWSYLRASPAFLIPVEALIAFLLWVQFSVGGSLYWKDGGAKDLSSYAALLFDVAPTNSMKAFLIDIFVLNFHWILLLLLIAGSLHWLVSQAWLAPSVGDAKKLKNKDVLFAIFLLLGTVYLTTRVRPWNNTRYVLAAYPPLILCACFSAVRLFRSRLVRAGVLWGVVLLFVVSCFRTVDPVSRGAFGTFPFGDHDLLDMISFFGTQRRDEMTYNLEFTRLDDLTRKIFADIKPTPHTPLVVGKNAIFELPTVDCDTHQPTKRRENACHLRYFQSLNEVSPWILGPIAKGEPLYFLAYPFFRNQPMLETLQSQYTQLWKRTYRSDGYAVDVYAFQAP